MNKEEKIIGQIEENIELLSLEEMKSLIIELSKIIPKSSQQYLLCMIKNLNNKLNEDKKLLDEMKQEIYASFKEIENGNMCLRCCEYETGTYSYYDADTNLEYWTTGELNDILNMTFNYIKNVVWHKKYADAIEIFDLLLSTEYMCEEVGNPDYDDSDEVYDSFERDIRDFKDSLNFDFNELLLYAIYSVIMTNHNDKNEKIFEYLKYGTINIMQVNNIGIEKIKNFDKFYDEWIKFLDNKKQNNMR